MRCRIKPPPTLLPNQVVEGDQRRGRRLMVFCNTMDSCRAADHHLRERGIPTGGRVGACVSACRSSWAVGRHKAASAQCAADYMQAWKCAVRSPPKSPTCHPHAPTRTHLLSHWHLHPVCYHGDVPMEERKAAIADFSAGEAEYAAGERPVLVATDLAARWVDAGRWIC